MNELWVARDKNKSGRICIYAAEPELCDNNGNSYYIGCFIHGLHKDDFPEVKPGEKCKLVLAR